MLEAQLSPRRVYPAAAIAVVAMIVLRDRIAPHDFWWHLAQGRTIVRTGVIPSFDDASFTQPNVPVFDQPWLAQLLLYALFVLGGPALVIVAQALLVGSSLALLLWLMIRVAGGRALTATLVFLFAVVPLVAPSWSVRPQSYALPLFVIVLGLATGSARGWRLPLWPLVPVMIVWVNVHGSFVLGLGILGLVTVIEGLRCARRIGGALGPKDWRRLVYGTLGAFAATLLNPRGPEIYRFAFGVSRQLAGAEIFAEWARPSPFTRDGWAFFAVAVALLIVVSLARVRAQHRPRATDLALVAVFFVLALTAVRNILWFGLVSAPLVTDALGALVPRLDDESATPSRVSAIVLVSAALATVGFLPWTRALLPFAPFEPYTADTPIAAVEHLRALEPSRRPQRLFHTEGTGSYLIWAAPEQRVFLDPRFALYPAELWKDRIRLAAGRDVKDLLAKYRIDGLLLIRPKEGPLIDDLAVDAAWDEVYEDASSVLFIAR